MLSGVAGEDRPGTPLTGQPEEIQHLPASDLSGFIDDDGCPRRNVALDEELGDRGGFHKAAPFHLDHLLTLGVQDDHLPSGGQDLVHPSARYEALPGRVALERSGGALMRWRFQMPVTAAGFTPRRALQAVRRSTLKAWASWETLKWTPI